MEATNKKTARGPYKNGIAKQKHIVDSSINLLIDKGYHNFSFRKVAKEAGVSIGNLQHFFSTKEILVEAILNTVISRYLEDFEELKKLKHTPKNHFRIILKKVILDLNTKKTTVFFPELWSLANHNEWVNQAMENMYERYIVVLKKSISEINPKLNDSQVEKLAVFICASTEGHTIFTGYNKKWRYLTESTIDMAYRSFLYLIETGDTETTD